MPQDVYSREVDFGASFSADGARITFDEFPPGLITQTLQYQYMQNISRIFDVSSKLIYLVAGRTSGQLSMARVLGPRRLVPAFYRKFGNVCNANNNNMNLTMQPGCNSPSDGFTLQQIAIRHAVITALGGGVNANDMLINESLNFMFLSMQMQES